MLLDFANQIIKDIHLKMIWKMMDKIKLNLKLKTCLKLKNQNNQRRLLMKKFKDLFEDSPAQDYQPNREEDDEHCIRAGPN